MLSFQGVCDVAAVHRNTFLKPVAFTSYECRNKLLQTYWLKTKKTYSLTVLELEIQNQGASRAVLPMKALGRILVCLFQLLVAASFPRLLATSLHSLPLF